MSEDLNAYKEAYTEKHPHHWDEQLLQKAYSQKIVEQLAKQSELTVLSLGIGPQLVSRAIRQQLSIAEYHIIEGSSDIIEKYRAETSPPANVVIHQAYFETCDLTARFDVIEMGFVLEHVDDPALILRKFRNLLKPDGLLFVAVPNARALHRLLGHAAGLLQDVYALSQADLMWGHKRYFDSMSIAQLVQDSGYMIRQRLGLVMKPLTTGQLRQLALAPNVEDALIEVGYDYPDIANSVLLIATPA